MYIVCRSNDENYGNVISVLRAEGEITSPNFIVNEVRKEKRLWLQEENVYARIMVDGQIMTPSQLERWVREEYQSLPKCSYCAKILSEQVYTHSFNESLFCTQYCADKDYHQQMDHFNDYEEIDL